MQQGYAQGTGRQGSEKEPQPAGTSDQDFGSNQERAAAIKAPAPDLRRGDRGKRVRQLQNAWVGLGFMSPAQRATGPGTFGPLTARATRGFQASRSLLADGIYGSRTAVALGGGSVGPPSSGSAPQGELRPGDRGEAVVKLQSSLVSLGHLTQAEMDTGAGIYGPRTESAVLSFQAIAGLGTDGVYGPQTTEAVQRALSSGKRHAPKTEEKSTGFEGRLPQPVLERGNNGAEVRKLQEALVSLGHMSSADLNTGPGVFGPRTLSALISFQASSGLSTDGVYGLKSAARMAMVLGVEAPQTTQREDRGFDRSEHEDLRAGVIAAAESHLGAPYYWGGDGPSMFDCSGFALYVLRSDMSLINWGDDTAAGIAGRLQSTSAPQRGDLVFYRGSNGITHVEFVISGSRTIGASGGGSSTRGDNPNAKVQYGDYTHDSRSKSFGSIEALLATGS